MKAIPSVCLFLLVACVTTAAAQPAEAPLMVGDPRPDVTAHPFEGIEGVTVDEAGNVYVPGGLGDTTYRITPQGAIIDLNGPDIPEEPEGDARSVMASGSCNWSSGFNAPGMNNVVFALTVFDDGGGPAL